MGEFKEITYDETNEIKMSLKNAIGLISNIHTMDDCKKMINKVCLHF